MQAKIFLASFLATIFAVGVIAAPQAEAPPGDVSTVVENGASFVGAPVPRPSGPVIPPKEGDVLSPSGSPSGVDPRDLVSRKPYSINWAQQAVTNFHNRKGGTRKLNVVLRRLLSRKQCITLCTPLPLNLIKLL